MGEKQNGPFQLSFNASLKADLQGSRVTSDGSFVFRGGVGVWRARDGPRRNSSKWLQSGGQGLAACDKLNGILEPKNSGLMVPGNPQWLSGS